MAIPGVFSLPGFLLLFDEGYFILALLDGLDIIWDESPDLLEVGFDSAGEGRDVEVEVQFGTILVTHQ